MQRAREETTTLTEITCEISRGDLLGSFRCRLKSCAAEQRQTVGEKTRELEMMEQFLEFRIAPSERDGPPVSQHTAETQPGQATAARLWWLSIVRIQFLP